MALSQVRICRPLPLQKWKDETCPWIRETWKMPTVLNRMKNHLSDFSNLKSDFSNLTHQGAASQQIILADWINSWTTFFFQKLPNLHERCWMWWDEWKIISYIFAIFSFWDMVILYFKIGNFRWILVQNRQYLDK